MFADLQERLKAFYAGLNPRERVLVLVMGSVATALLVFFPFYLLTSSISEIQDENQAIIAVLRDVSRDREKLARREAERAAAQARYNETAPALASFLEAKAKEQSLTLREVNDQPEKIVGDFTRREVRATLPTVTIQSTVKMLEAIERSSFPIAITRLQFESRRQNDEYNLTVGVLTFDNPSAKGGGKGKGGAKDIAKPAGGRGAPATPPPGASRVAPPPGTSPREPRAAGGAR